MEFSEMIDQRRQFELNELRKRRSLSGLILARARGHVARLTAEHLAVSKRF
jgi:hypothetical protein